MSGVYKDAQDYSLHASVVLDPSPPETFPVTFVIRSLPIPTSPIGEVFTTNFPREDTEILSVVVFYSHL